MKVDKRKGMTLIEVIVAVTILAVVALPLFTTYSTSFILINKRQKNINNGVVIRLAKENAVDCIKDAKPIKSYKDLNGNTSNDDNDAVIWQSGAWNIPDTPGGNTVSNLKLIDSNNKLYPDYEFSIREESYSDGNFPDVKKFMLRVTKKNSATTIKSFYIFVDTQSG